MTTKKSKPKASKEDYLRNTAKNIVWPIDLTINSILVPSDELDEAEDNYFVKLLLNEGMHIQSVIPGMVKKNELITHEFKVKEKVVESEGEAKYKITDPFLVLSTGEVLEITSFFKHSDRTPMIRLKYENSIKKGKSLEIPEAQLDKSLRSGLWIKGRNLF